jgi:hypothetical protein
LAYGPSKKSYSIDVEVRDGIIVYKNEPLYLMDRNYYTRKDVPQTPWLLMPYGWQTQSVILWAVMYANRDIAYSVLGLEKEICNIFPLVRKHCESKNSKPSEPDGYWSAQKVAFTKHIARFMTKTADGRWTLS